MTQSRIITTLAIVVTGSLLAGCAWFGHRAQPAWVEGNSGDYPADQYLLGVGQADTRPSAEERAYGAVSRIFKARVEAEAKDWESFLVLEARGKADTERRLTLDQITRVSTDKVLESVRVLDAWMNPATRQHHVLAGMQRAQAGTARSSPIYPIPANRPGRWRQSEASGARSRTSCCAKPTTPICGSFARAGRGRRADTALRS
jgi:hypothetical protein